MGGGSGGNFGNTRGSRSTSNKNDRFHGEPNTIKEDGYKKTYIDKNGKAYKEIHDTDHGNPKHHTKPHEHRISWDGNGNPIFSK